MTVPSLPANPVVVSVDGGGAGSNLGSLA